MKRTVTHTRQWAEADYGHRVTIVRPLPGCFRERSPVVPGRREPHSGPSSDQLPASLSLTLERCAPSIAPGAFRAAPPRQIVQPGKCAWASLSGHECALAYRPDPTRVLSVWRCRCARTSGRHLEMSICRAVRAHIPKRLRRSCPYCRRSLRSAHAAGSGRRASFAFFRVSQGGYCCRPLVMHLLIRLPPGQPALRPQSRHQTLLPFSDFGRDVLSTVSRIRTPTCAPVPCGAFIHPLRVEQPWNNYLPKVPLAMHIGILVP